MPLHPFEIKLIEAWPPEKRAELTTLVAVSGGPDSVALLRGLWAGGQRSGGRIVAAHFNHRLRGDEADADAHFVSELCDTLGCRCIIGTSGGGAAAGSEAGFRDERYAFLTRTAAEIGARYVMTAHTADDQAETILHRIIRGTGLAGLAGIERVRALDHGLAVVRPLLSVRHHEVHEYLAAIGQPFRSDSTNADPRFMRNRLRSELLPLLAAEYNPRIVDALLRLGIMASDTQQVMEQLTADLAARCDAKLFSGHLTLDVRPLAQVPRHRLRELFIYLWKQEGWPMQAMGYDEWEQLASLVTSHGEARRSLPGGVLARRTATHLLLVRGG